MWPFSKKWQAPEPQLAMLVALSGVRLPSVVMLANPAGEGGAVAGMAGPADQPPAAENMTSPMQPGDYVAISPGGTHCSLHVTRVERESISPMTLEPEIMEAAGISAEALDRFNNADWRISIEMAPPEKDILAAVKFATSLARRLATLGQGVVMDVMAYRFFGPDGWAVEKPLADFDVREHVHVHIESGDDGGWVHTHGLLKFGRPELELYAVPADQYGPAYGLLMDLSQYVATTALILPGQTCGDPDQPFYAREGTKNREGHWEDRSVLELVDIDDRRRPVPAGAPKAMRAFCNIG